MMESWPPSYVLAVLFVFFGPTTQPPDKLFRGRGNRYNQHNKNQNQQYNPYIYHFDKLSSAPEREAKIELVCDYEVIECPPTSVPREEALCLAVNIGVGLTKVYSEAFGPVV